MTSKNYLVNSLSDISATCEAVSYYVVGCLESGQFGGAKQLESASIIIDG